MSNSSPRSDGLDLAPAQPRGYGDFLGIDGLVRRLKEGVGGASSVHAYLFCGPRGTGKRSLARITARALNCQGAGEKPCDACPSCQRYLAGVHPDHFELVSDKAVGVDEVRALLMRVAVRPFEGGRHTVVIHEADTMTPQAQNALLKTLEEPPGDAVFFLLAAERSALLPTVLSRTRLIRFAPLEDELVARALAAHGIDPARAAELAAVAQGSVGEALRLQDDPDYWALRERVTSSLMRLKGKADIAAASAILKDDKSSASAALTILEQLARHQMRLGEGMAETEAPDYPALRAPGSGAALLRGAMRARQMLARNVNWLSALEMAYIDLLDRGNIGGQNP